MAKAYKYLLLVICIAMLLLPALQKGLNIFGLQKYKLVKVPDDMALPAPTFNGIIENTYQDSVSLWFNFTTGFKPLLVRLRNQVDYSCFNVTHGKIIEGKNQCLYIDENLVAYMGTKVYPDRLLRGVDSIAMLRSFLAHKNIPLLFVMAPGKADYLTAWLPPGYTVEKGRTTYYTMLTEQLKKRGIPYADLRAFFDSTAKSYPHPVFSKQGLHWSAYGASIALDTIYKTIAATLNFEPMAVDLSHDTISSEPRFPEDDLAEMANMLYIPHIDTLAYPAPVGTVKDSARTKKPKILFVGDSFSYIFGLTSMPRQLFDPATRYWFYMKTEKDFADVMKDGADLSKTDVAKAIQQFDMVIVLSTEGRYDYGDYGLYGRLVQ